MADQIFGNYKVVKKIAEGGFGVTYKAEHIRLGTPVCIKYASRISKKDKKTLLDEAKMIWDLRHFGIPAVRDVFETSEGHVAMVMSYIPGPTLADIRKKSDHEDGIDPEHVGWITDRLLNILKYLHLHGVVHGDIKPQNIIIQPRDHTIVLVDYGLSDFMPLPDSKTKGYTPYFAAPEQIERNPLIPETDFYSLGMTMIYALGGDVEKIKVPGNTPKAMCEFIKKLIKIEPLSRPSWSDEDLCDSIRQVRVDDFGRDMSGLKPLKI